MVQLIYVLSRQLPFLCYCTAFVIIAVVAQEDLFLFAGQSNMIGWSTGGMSVERDSRLFIDTYSILANTSVTEEERRSMLLDRYRTSASSFPGAFNPNGTATAQADGVMSLVQQKLTIDLQTKLAGAYCSFTDPANNKTRVAKKLVAANGCGQSYGHELVFSHRLKKSQPYEDKNFFTVKVAKGGTRIQEWVPNGGQYWKDLRSAIRNTAGNWKLIVWHQGENDAVASKKTINQTIYRKHLSHLITALRSEMFAKSSGVFQCRQAIPVIIVLIHWPFTTRGSFQEQALAVRQAQSNFVKRDPRSRIVILDGLEEFYHLSAPSLLISGSRIAEAFLDLLTANYSCPNNAAPSALTFQPDFSRTSYWGRALRKACGCGQSVTVMFTSDCVRRRLLRFFQLDVDARLVRSPDDLLRWRRKVRKAYVFACQRRS